MGVNLQSWFKVDGGMFIYIGCHSDTSCIYFNWETFTILQIIPFYILCFSWLTELSHIIQAAVFLVEEYIG